MEAIEAAAAESGTETMAEQAATLVGDDVDARRWTRGAGTKVHVVCLMSAGFATGVACTLACILNEGDVQRMEKNAKGISKKLPG